MIYLRKFETTAQYEAAESGLILPNVSLVTETMDVYFNPYVEPQHDWVEIGGHKWATMNIGAETETDYGLYFQWGDTQGYTAAQVGSGEGKKYFSREDYIYYNDGSYTKYNTSDNKTTLEPTDDAVTAAWGGNWRIPTKEEYQDLKSATTSAWTADYEGSGVAGLVLTSIDDSSKKLFFPACGYAKEGSMHNVGAAGGYGGYWLSSHDTAIGNDLSISMNFGSASFIYGYNSRIQGECVRGILDEQ